MVSPFVCDICAFDFGALPERLDFTLGESTSATSCPVSAAEGGTARVMCPICGNATTLRLGKMGIILRGSGANAEFARWKSDSKESDSPVTLVGSLQVRFSRLATLEARDACYQRMPAFRDAAGDLRIPDLPLKPEFFDCLDVERSQAQIDRGHPLSEVVGSLCRVKLFLRGVPDPVPFDIPLQMAKAGPATAANAFADVNLKVWPKFEIKGWKHYLVGASGISDEGEALIRDRRLTFQARVGNKWWELGKDVPRQRAGGSVVFAVDARPTWVAVECVDSEQGRNAGGMWFLRPPDPTRVLDLANGDEVEFGLDFGTSNTCVAYFDVQKNLPFSIGGQDDSFWNEYILHAGAERTSIGGPELWPSSGGTVQNFSFASEIVLPMSLRELSGALRKDDWVYGVDFGLSGRQKPAYPEEEHVVRHFKWSEMLTEPAFRRDDKVKSLQANYLTAVLMNAYLRLAIARGKAASSVIVKYSYPMAFTEGDLTTLKRSTDHAARRLNELTGVRWHAPILGVDESSAAARVGGDGDDCSVHVFLDMGGGSTDIAVRVGHIDRGLAPRYLTSVAFAGTHVVNSFKGVFNERERLEVGNCLSMGVTPGDLHRRIRESRNVMDLLDDGEVFKKSHSQSLVKRVRNFYFYLTEYVARILAAGLIERRLIDDLNPGRVKFGFYFLGNGWGFASAIEATRDPETTRAKVSARIFDRTLELLREDESQGAKTLPLLLTERPTYHMIRIDGHPKEAVAKGLLNINHAAGPGNLGGGRSLGIIGITTRTRDREIPWYAYYDSKLERMDDIIPPSVGAASPSPVTGPSMGGPPPFGMPPPFMPQVEHAYYIHVGGSQQGPLSFAQLKQYADAGQISPQIPVWRQGLAAWGPASLVPELAALFAPPPLGGPPPFGMSPPSGGPPPLGGPPVGGAPHWGGMAAVAPQASANWLLGGTAAHPIYQRLDPNIHAMTWPAISPAVPSDLTPVLRLRDNLTLADIAARIRNRVVHSPAPDWFTKGPYEMLLEEIVRPNLGRVV